MLVAVCSYRESQQCKSIPENYDITINLFLVHRLWAFLTVRVVIQTVKLLGRPYLSKLLRASSDLTNSLNGNKA